MLNAVSKQIDYTLKLIMILYYIKCHSSLQRTFSGRTVEDSAKGKYKKGGDFSYTNQSFSSLPEDFQIRGSENDGTSSNSKTPMGNIKCYNFSKLI